MADYLYCGTPDQVPAVQTQALLQGQHHAIWCPPHRLIPWHVTTQPANGDRVWLLWRSTRGAAPLLLGGGRIVMTPQGGVLWTNRTLPGVRPAAEALGYEGPANMAFLHLTGTVSPAQLAPVPNLGAFANGLNEASAAEVTVLGGVLVIP